MQQERNALKRVLWSWVVNRHPRLEDQVIAAAAGGFDVLTIPYRQYRASLDAGMSAQEMKRIAEGRGVVLDFLDGVMSWAPVRWGADVGEFVKEAFAFSVDDALEMCAVLGLTTVVAASAFEAGAVPLPDLVEAFGEFCDRAREAGVWVDLEPVPMSGIPTLDLAWRIVNGANRSNSGIMFDTWHFQRGDADLGLVRAIPPERIVNVQLVDGDRHPKWANPWEEGLHGRYLPGEGDLPLIEILATLTGHHAISTIGPEGVSDDVAGMDPAQLGALAGESTDEVLAKAGLTGQVDR
jgi:sugar phosphate isomerase/epimerase